MASRGGGGGGRGGGRGPGGPGRGRGGEVGGRGPGGPGRGDGGHQQQPYGGGRGGGYQQQPYGRGEGGGYQHQPYGRGEGGGRGGGHQQQPYGRGEGGGRGGGYQQQPLARGEGGYQQPLGYSVGGGGRGRGAEVPAAPRPVAPVAAPRPAAPVASPRPAAATTSARPPPPPTAASSSSAPAAAAASALASGMGRLAVADPAPRAPAPAARSEPQAPAYQHPPQAPPVSSKEIAHAARPGYGTLGRPVNVLANHFLADVADKDICHYDVSITPEPKARRINRVLLSELVKVHAGTSLDRKTPAYDGSKSLYTAGKLPFKSMDFVVKLGKERREIEYKVTIGYVGRANLYHLQEFLRGRQRDSPQDTIQALDVVLRESPSLNYVTVSRSFFSKGFGNDRDIGEGLECWRGYYQSLRPTQMGLSLNIDISSTAFYKAIPVIEFVEKCVGRRNSRQPISDRDRLKLKKALRGVRVETTHGKRSIYKITGVTSVPLAQLSFSPNEEGQMTVVQYFATRYNYRLVYTAWPCLQSGSDSKPIYLPMEVCQIIEGQKYPKKLSSAQVTEILKATCERPENRQQSILRMVGINNYSADRLAQAFGITIANQMAKVQARVLPPPVLKYHESGRDETCVPSHGKWSMSNKKMVNGGNVHMWTCLNFSRWPTNEAERFCGDLARKCNSMGMVFNQTAVTEIRSASPNQIEVALRDVHVRAPRLQLLIVILPEDAGHYGKIKRLCETELGIVSQCIKPSSRITGQYFENVALKINVKVGGRNTVLERAVLNSPPFESKNPTIFFGADVTHPAAGEDSSASIAAVVASMDTEATTYKALVSAQAHRQEIIQDLFWTGTDPEKGTPVNGGMIRELLLSFYKNTGKKPGRIIFYRDGVSEGQFDQVLLHEIDAIRKACASMQQGYLPKVTFIVVQKRHHTRLFLEHRIRNDPDNKSGNILPGTVVDRDICHPSEFDFYLCSHAGIMGTSRAAHYHVLYDENDFSADMLQMLSNSLCYTYARCTRSVSIVPPVYYAHLAAFRARFYDERDDTDTASGVSGGAGGGPPAFRGLPQVHENVKRVMYFC